MFKNFKTNNYLEKRKEIEEFNTLIVSGIQKSELFRKSGKDLNYILNMNLIPTVITKFFSLYKKIEVDERKNLIENISKFFIKIKRIHIITIILHYFHFIESLEDKIKNDNSEEKIEIQFDYAYDINFECSVEVNLKINENNKLSNVYDNYVKIDLKFYNDNKAKNHYLLSTLSNIIYIYNSDNKFNVYKLNKDCNTVTIFQNSVHLKINKVDTTKIFEKYLNKVKRKDVLVFLENDIINHIKLTKRNTSNFSKTYEDLRDYLEFKVRNYKGTKEQCLPFGSVTQFSYNILSDLEVSIFTRKDENKNLSEFLEDIYEALQEKEDQYEDVTIRHTKRTKLINFRDKINKVKVDLMLNNEFGVLNSDLIRNYCLFDSRCMILINIIKDWSKFKNINGNFNGYLSSYCYTLMVIYFLQKIRPPILPVFHTHEFNNFSEFTTHQENLHYFVNLDFTNYSKCTDNKSSIAELLFQFFMFFLHYFNELDYCIDISNSSAVFRYNEISYLNRNSLGRKGFFSYCFIDPIDYSYNPGSFFLKNSSQEEKFKDELKMAVEKFLNQKSIFDN